MKNFVLSLVVLALIGSAGAQYAPNTWGLATTGAGNPYTFDGTGEVTDQTPDVWGTWGTQDGGAGDGGANDNIVSGGAVTIDTEGYEVVFSHDNALLDLGAIPPVVGEELEVVIQVLSISGPGYVSMKIEYYGTDAFPNNDNGADNIGVADFEADGQTYDSTDGAGEYHFLTSSLASGAGFPIPVGTTAVTPVITVADGAVGDEAIVVIDEIWIGKPGEYPGGTKCSSPSPASGSVNPVGAITELTWVLPEQALTGLTLEFEQELSVDGSGKPVYDPNWGAASGVPTTTVTKTKGTAATVQGFIVGMSPYTLPLPDDSLFSWQMTTTDPVNGTVDGPVWLFRIGDAFPVPAQPVNQYMFLSQADGDGDSNIRTFTVTAAYTDDGKSPIVDANLVNLNWNWDPDGTDGWPTNPDGEKRRGVTKISEVWTPGAGTHTAGSVTATFQTHYDAADPNYSTDIMGYWDIQLEVTDGLGTTAGTAGHHEIWDLCGEAAAADPLDLFDSTYDVDLNCKTDLVDLADFLSKWLNQSVLYE